MIFVKRSIGGSPIQIEKIYFKRTGNHSGKNLKTLQARS
jgi:hypothetical protein